ncbi:MAG: hypothetical protein AB2L11_08140 [Syntrophobacteraceae bacterium]
MNVFLTIDLNGIGMVGEQIGIGKGKRNGEFMTINVDRSEKGVN